MANCVFFGHRDAPALLQSALTDAIKKLYLEHDVRTFMVGGYGNFDRMATEAVRVVKSEYEDIELLLIVAYLPAPSVLYDGYDQVIYPEGLELVPQRFAITHRNRRMVEMADYMIAYVGVTWGSAAQALAYGRKCLQESRIINLYE